MLTEVKCKVGLADAGTVTALGGNLEVAELMPNCRKLWSEEVDSRVQSLEQPQLPGESYVPLHPNPQIPEG